MVYMKIYANFPTIDSVHQYSIDRHKLQQRNGLALSPSKLCRKNIGQQSM